MMDDKIGLCVMIALISLVVENGDETEMQMLAEALSIIPDRIISKYMTEIEALMMQSAGVTT